MTDVYVTMVTERHTDIEANVFASELSAIAYARSVAEKCADHPSDVEEHDYGKPAWLYYVSWSEEGDAAWVYKTEVQP